MAIGRRTRRLGVWLCTLVVALGSHGAGAREAKNVWLPSGETSAKHILAAIDKEKRDAPDVTVTGITVPHHLLAADLMARGFWAVKRRDWKRVIVVSPDHFRQTRKPFATTTVGFQTVLGPLATDRNAARKLLRSPLFETSTLFATEHGVAALLPFVRHFFPKAKIVPVVISVSAKRDTVAAGVAVLKGIVDRDTLVIQSTDFSHYLPLSRAVLHDQETMNVIAAGDADKIFDLKAVDHLDSQAAQYVQMRLQAEVFGARPVIVANRNSEDYGAGDGRTTSYLVQVYGPDPMTLGQFRYADQTVTYFAGDTFPARYWGPLLIEPKVAKAVTARVLAITGGAPIVANLEGAVVDGPVVGLPPLRHAMESVVAIPFLRAINVKAASLANNHAFDLGAEGLKIAKPLLVAAGIAPVPHMGSADVNSLRVVGLNYVVNPSYADYPRIADGDYDRLCRSTLKAPVFAFVHWGREYTNEAGADEREIADKLLECGVSAIIGGHSHRAATKLEAMRGGGGLMLYSLGNFIFDQKKNDVSSALLEVRVFSRGTFAARLVPIENLFAFAQSEFSGRPARH